jgi:hypothetical protein
VDHRCRRAELFIDALGLADEHARIRKTPDLCMETAEVRENVGSIPIFTRVRSE